MKNRLTSFLLRLLFISSVFTIQSCQQSDVQLTKTQPTETFNKTGSCYQELLLIGTLTQVQGEIVSETNVKPVIYGIKTATVQSVNGYTAQIFVPCNLPDNLKRVGQQVSVSGRVLSYGKDNAIRMDIYGQPFESTAITSKGL